MVKRARWGNDDDDDAVASKPTNVTHFSTSSPPSNDCLWWPPPSPPPSSQWSTITIATTVNHWAWSTLARNTQHSQQWIVEHSILLLLLLPLLFAMVTHLDLFFTPSSRVFAAVPLSAVANTDALCLCLCVCPLRRVLANILCLCFTSICSSASNCSNYRVVVFCCRLISCWRLFFHNLTLCQLFLFLLLLLLDFIP